MTEPSLASQFTFTTALEEIARLRNIIRLTHVALELMHSVIGREMTDADFSKLWNGTVELLGAELGDPQ